MSRAGILAIGVAAVLGIGLALRAAQHASTPPFEIDIILKRRPQLEIDGVRFGWRTATGVVEARAAHASPATDRLGHLSVGPSQFLALHDVHAHARSDNGDEWTAHARTGQLRGHQLRLVEKVTVRRGNGSERGVGEFRFDLRTGAVGED